MIPQWLSLTEGEGNNTGYLTISTLVLEAWKDPGKPLTPVQDKCMEIASDISKESAVATTEKLTLGEREVNQKDGWPSFWHALSSALLPEDATHNQGEASHVNQVNQDSSLGGAPCSGDSN